MQTRSVEPAPRAAVSTFDETYARVRAETRALCAPLAIEDYVVQSMPDASPVKWHLAHTTWFFERFVLSGAVAGYRPYDGRYEFLFNSYYEAVGPRHPRAERGLLTRPTVAEIYDYRTHVDEQMARLLARGELEPALAARITLGVNHEQQHQELVLTDLKHVLAANPLRPAYHARPQPASRHAPPLRWHPYAGGIVETGAVATDFCFDNELPRHRSFLEPFELAGRAVTNAEYLEFIRDGGYTLPALWLADGWSTVQANGWTRPLYWSPDLDTEFTLAGTLPLDPAAPVCHLSYYEADAFARWAGARLPTETEWEVAAGSLPIDGNLLESRRLQPVAAPVADTPAQLFGDVWEWTSSSYTPYPGFRPAAGAIGEYNGKFMVNQLVLRGGSCATPRSHLRASYRNFFYPHQRWQFMGLRLARGG